jgi:hypothetical protein
MQPPGFRAQSGCLQQRLNVSSAELAWHRNQLEGCQTALAMVFKLAQAAEKHWCRLDGQSQLPKVILGAKFTDGIEVAREQVQTAA